MAPTRQLSPATSDTDAGTRQQPVPAPTTITPPVPEPTQPATPPRPVVVGVDGTPDSELALDWAVDEARRRGLPLHLIHARSLTHAPPSALSPSALSPSVTTSWHDPGWVLRAAHDRINHLSVDHPHTLTVTQDDVLTPASTALIAASATADTIVLGSHHHAPDGPDAPGSALLGSTARRVADHATCPVVIVRRPVSRTTTTPHLVLGIDGSPTSDAATTYAFHRAHDLALPLTVIHAWPPTHHTGPSHEQPDLNPGQTSTAHTQLASIRHTLSPHRQQYPDVDVHVILAPGTPLDVLVEQSWTAELVIVGSRGLGSVRGLLLGSVSEGVLQHAHSPVAIVRPPTP